MRNIFSLSIDSRRRTVAQRGNQAPVAAETQSLVGLAWCSQCCSSSPTVDPWALWGDLLPFVFTSCPNGVGEMNHSCLWEASCVDEKWGDLRLLPRVFNIDWYARLFAKGTYLWFPFAFFYSLAQVSQLRPFFTRLFFHSLFLAEICVCCCHVYLLIPISLSVCQYAHWQAPRRVPLP